MSGETRQCPFQFSQRNTNKNWRPGGEWRDPGNKTLEITKGSKEWGEKKEKREKRERMCRKRGKKREDATDSLVPLVSGMVQIWSEEYDYYSIMLLT